MKDSASRFGYFVSKDRQIDFDGNSHDVARKVAAAKFTDFSLRRIILLVRRGETRGLAKESMKCMLCGKCQLVCPRGVNTRNLILQINRVLQTQLP